MRNVLRNPLAVQRNYKFLSLWFINFTELRAKNVSEKIILNQPNLTAARVLTIATKWLNCKGCESEFSYHYSNDMEHL